MREIFNALCNTVVRGVVAFVSPGKLNTIQAQLTANEVSEGLEHIESFGLATRPLTGAELLALFPGGDRSLGYVVAVTDRRYRPQPLESGEVCIYSPFGQRIHLKSDGSIVIQAGKLIVDCDVEVVGNITATGEISDGAGTMSNMRAAYNAHTGHHAGGSTPDRGM